MNTSMEEYGQEIDKLYQENDNIKISIVICTYSFDRYSDTMDVINSLNGQTYPNTEIVLIIDQNTELLDKFKKDLKSFKDIKIGLSTLHGLSNARNKGVELSSGDIIAFIDDDAVADPNWVTNLAKGYIHQSIIGVGGKIKPLWIDSTIAHWIPEEFYWAMGCSYKSQRDEKHYIRSNFGSNMSFRKDVFEKIGNFDSRLGIVGNLMRTGEETEFSLRATNYIKNSKIVYDPDVIVYHKIFNFRKSISYLLKRCYSYGYAMGEINNGIGSDGNTENSFLKFLIQKSYIDRIKKIMMMNNCLINLSQTFVITFFTICVGAGYLNKRYIIKNNIEQNS